MWSNYNRAEQWAACVMEAIPPLAEALKMGKQCSCPAADLSLNITPAELRSKKKKKVQYGDTLRCIKGILKD